MKVKLRKQRRGGSTSVHKQSTISPVIISSPSFQMILSFINSWCAVCEVSPQTSLLLDSRVFIVFSCWFPINSLITKDSWILTANCFQDIFAFVSLCICLVFKTFLFFILEVLHVVAITNKHLIQNVFAVALLKFMMKILLFCVLATFQERLTFLF